MDEQELAEALAVRQAQLERLEQVDTSGMTPWERSLHDEQVLRVRQAITAYKRARPKPPPFPTYRAV
jgi:hypothetical protein